MHSFGIAQGAEAGPTTIVQSLDGSGWILATDPKNIGRAEKWFAAPRVNAVATKVPWIIQDAFPGYHGVAWYWRDFVAPTIPHPQGRGLLRFWAVDYQAEVWLNGQLAGGHEGGETPFTLDVTEALQAGRTNRVAVRVLNPTHGRIDGIAFNETPRQARVMPYSAGAAYNHGGIVGSVELLAAPALRVEDVVAQAEPKSGVIKMQANMTRFIWGGAERSQLDLCDEIGLMVYEESFA